MIYFTNFYNSFYCKIYIKQLTHHISILNIPSRNMNDFYEEEDEVFDDAYEKSPWDCKHEKSEYDDYENVSVCLKCGIIVNEISYQPEWSCYGNNSRTFRYHFSNVDHKGIQKVFNDLNIQIQKNVIQLAEKKYFKIIGKKTYRGRNRKSIIASCVYYTLVDMNKSRVKKEISKMFDLKNFSFGEEKFLISFPEYRTLKVEPSEMIIGSLIKLKINKKYSKDIKEIYLFIKNASIMLKRSCVHSLISSVIWLYISCTEIYDGNRKTFAGVVQLSEITIAKLVKKMKKIILSLEC